MKKSEINTLQDIFMNSQIFGNNVYSGKEFANKDTENDGVNEPDVIDIEPTEVQTTTESNESSTEIAVVEDKAPEEEKVLVINTITPYRIIFPEKKPNPCAILIYLCRDDKDNVFILDRHIPIKDDDHKEALECIPFSADKEFDFANEKICTNILLNYMDNYVCDMKFGLTKEEIKEADPKVTMTLTNVKTKESIKATMKSDVFAAFMFIENYMKENIINEHDLALAVFSSSKPSPAEFYVVDTIEKIVAMAPAEVNIEDERSIIDKLKDFMNFKNKEERVYSTSIGLVIKVSRIVGTDRETDYLLIPFDVGVEFDESKFKGATVDSIVEDYYGDSDQYVTSLTIDSVTFKDIEKTFMMIKAKSKTGTVKLFLLDSTVQKELQDKINEY